MDFVKMHGLGNDFVIADSSFFEGRDISSDALRICDRRTGIGADGLILYGTDGDMPSMKIWNSDGSTAQMCGNGIRCLALLLYRKGIVKERSFKISTDAGIKEVAVDDESCKVGVDMGDPIFKPSDIPAILPEGESVYSEIEALGRTFNVIAVSMGNPHAVIFEESGEKTDLLKFGPAIEKHPAFPEGVNVEFVTYVNPHMLKVSVWERGAGVTQACGTGACASYAAACRSGRCSLYADVELPGGILRISNGKTGSIQMTGPASFVFEGRYEL